MLSGINVTGNFQLSQIDDRHVVVGRAGNERARSIRLHLDAGSALAKLNPLHFAARGGVEYSQIGTAQGRNEYQLSIRVNFRRLAPITFAVSVRLTFLADKSTIEMVPS